MSKFVRIQTELRDVSLIKRALDDLKLAYGENERYTHVWSGFSGQVPFVIRAQGATFAFRATPEGIYEVVGDDMQMTAVRAHLQAIQQRYAYHKVLAEVENAGFSLVEARVGADCAIRMTVRRWQ